MAEIRSADESIISGKSHVRAEDCGRITGETKEFERSAPRWLGGAGGGVKSQCISGDAGGADYGVHVFRRNGGMVQLQKELEGQVDVRMLPKDYSQAEIVREVAAEQDAIAADPFYVVDLSVVLDKLNQWRRNLPRVRPFYAVKCNNDVAICRMLAMAGCGFDCASQAEIQMGLEMGVRETDIIYANPCKQSSMLKFAKSAKVHLMTADNRAELHKISQVFPEAHVVLRIAVDDSKSVCRFNSKFGAAPEDWRPLLALARDLNLTVRGVSFHVGSGCADAEPFATAVESAKQVFDMAEEYGHDLKILDCGGGFPGTDDTNLRFEDVARTLSLALDEHFPAGCGVDIIGEPGRYMVAASHTYAVSVIAKRELTASQLADSALIESFGSQINVDDTNSSSGFSTSSSETMDALNAIDALRRMDPQVALYVNDGVYGSFNCVVFDHAIVTPIPLHARGQTVPTKIFGPTCDSIDVVLPCTDLPAMSVGDWIYFEAMGAYTRCAASKFNGQGGFSLHYVCQAESEKSVAPLEVDATDIADQ